MIGYSKERIRQYFHRIHLDELSRHGFIDNEQRLEGEKLTEEAYKTTNFFVGIGLFLLSCVIISAALGLMALMLAGALDSYPSIFSFIAAIGLFFFLQKIVIDDRKQFRSGIDDAFLYAALLMAWLGALLLLDTIVFDDPLFTTLFFMPFFGLPGFLYRDRLLIGLSVLSVFAFVFALFYKLGSGYLLFLPFATMVVATTLYILASKQQKLLSEEIDHACLDIIKWIAIITFYAAGNIYVVMELSAELGLTDAFTGGIKTFFYVYTITVPIIFIYRGLKHKSLLFLNVGLGALLAGVLAIRHYLINLQLETELILGGLVLIGTAWAALNYFKNGRRAISTRVEDASNGYQIESLIIDETLGKSSSTDGNFSGKGGSFGGGGSSGSF